MSRRRIGVVAVTVLGLAACSGVPHGHPAPSPATVITSDPALDGARAGFDTARMTVLTDLATIPAAAAALDAIDAQASKGAFDPAQRAQPAAVKKSAAASAALGTLTSALKNYFAAITSLAAEAADPELSAAQAAALRALAAAATSEESAETALQGAITKGWPAYTQLVAAQALWIMRAGAGYYPHSNDDLYDAMRAGEAYVVLVNPFRTALSAERKSLASGTSTVTAARATTEAAIASAGTAFR